MGISTRAVVVGVLLCAVLILVLGSWQTLGHLRFDPVQPGTLAGTIYVSTSTQLLAFDSRTLTRHRVELASSEWDPRVWDVHGRTLTTQGRRGVGYVLSVIDLDGKTSPRHFPLARPLLSLRVSNDGARVAMVADPRSPPDPSLKHKAKLVSVRILDLASGNTTLVADNVLARGRPAWTSTGTILVTTYSRQGARPDGTNVWSEGVAEYRDTNLTNLRSGWRQPSLARAGTRRFLLKDGVIHEFTENGHTAVGATKSGGDVYCVSPDGRTLLVQATLGGGPARPEVALWQDNGSRRTYILNDKMTSCTWSET